MCIGEFTKEQLGKLVKKFWEIQKEANPENDENKKFLIWVSNDVFTDEEVRTIIKENFKDGKVEVMDLVEMSDDEIEKARSKGTAM